VCPQAEWRGRLRTCEGLGARMRGSPWSCQKAMVSCGRDEYEDIVKVVLKHTLGASSLLPRCARSSSFLRLVLEYSVASPWSWSDLS